jgi:hypothetical protein
MSNATNDTLALPSGGPPFLMEEPRGLDRALDLDDIESSAESLRRAALVSGGRNPVFALMVEGEDDITGLVAYALYKQSKRDWMMEFATRNGRSPNDEEIDSYILGERTPRRIATYRKLATDALERFRKSGHTVDKLMTAAGVPHAAAASAPRRGLGEQVQFFAVSAATGAILTLIAIYVAPRLIAG